MKRSRISYIIMTLVMSIVMSNAVMAQRNIYSRFEFGAGNVWTFAGMQGISIIINQLAHRPLTEATLRFSIPYSEYGNLNSYSAFEDFNHERFDNDPEKYGNSKDYIKFNGRNLLSNVIVGEKLGYLSDNLSSINYCIYGSAYYNLQQFKLMIDEENYDAVCTQRMQVGGGLMLIFGSIEKTDRYIFDGGIRYNIPVHFKGDGIEGSTNDNMNKGISSHYMFKWSNNNAIAVGATVDIMHYNFFKNEELCGDQSKVFEFGITLSLLF